MLEPFPLSSDLSSGQIGISEELAESCGVTLVLETSPREYTVTHDSKDVVRMIEEVGSAALSGMIDTATLGFSGETMTQAIRDLAGHLDHVHFADGVPNGHLVPGEGTLDLRSMLKALDDAGYTKSISLEILSCSGNISTYCKAEWISCISSTCYCL